MVSFGVSSLFTNIPLEQVIDICIDFLFDKRTIDYKDYKLDRSNLRKLLAFTIKESHFYIMLNFMTKLILWLWILLWAPLGQHIYVFSEEKYLNDCPSQVKPILCHCYLDDFFCLFKDRIDVDLSLSFI